MSDSTRDRIEGKVDELVGRGKQGVGEATDNPDLHDEGVAQQGEGEAKQGLAAVKDKIDDVVKKVTGGN